jgi:hypothetical protein
VIILHNLVIEMEGEKSGAQFADIHTAIDEDEDTANNQYKVIPEGEAKREMLIDVLMTWRIMWEEQRIRH